ncbi:hypothetical protein SAMN05421863_109811 [Nitrosomonas communis]|uniref:Uncharacterized protein n=1 Tax=Nitrosomonas communis TaxID=44574 RepID=A0A1I4W4X2_9PROT|nr:hypothetical protein SAMN05421863_109811 [Nitrosomonas communis]
MAVRVIMIFMLFDLYLSLAETMKLWVAGIIMRDELFFATILIVIIADKAALHSPKVILSPSKLNQLNHLWQSRR